jgi:4-hydroxy-3-polyprenylbenzoate decarboxylase
LLAIGSERYTPYLPTKQPAEILTIANHILGTGQLSLAKFLFITADDHNNISTHHEAAFFQYILERLHNDRDIHFHTHTTMDTLDYSGTGLNTGSKVVFAAYGDPIRTLNTELPDALKNVSTIVDAKLIIPGVVAIQTKQYIDASETTKELKSIEEQLSNNIDSFTGTPLFIWCDDAAFTSQNLRNFLWVAFTRSNPSHDIHGIQSFYENKHWGCKGPIVIDARIKPHHAPAVELDPAVVKRTNRLFEKGGSLYGIR